MNLAAGLTLAAGSAVGLNLSFYAQHDASNRLDAVSVRHPIHALLTLFGDRMWLLSYGVGWIGWALYIVALRFAPLSLVQGVGAGGIGLLALFASIAGDRPLETRERYGAWIAVGGLLLLVVSLGSHQSGRGPGDPHAVLVWIGICVVAAVLLGGPVGRIVGAGAGLGAAAGLFYAAGDIATKGAVSGLGLEFVVLLLIGHFVGFILIQLAFQRGSVLASAGLSSMFTNAVPIVAGATLFHEVLPGGWAGAIRVAAFVAVTVGAILLAGKSERADFGRTAALRSDC